jgi:hypothetical protein
MVVVIAVPEAVEPLFALLLEETGVELEALETAINTAAEEAVV